jgi:hypothetical protein
VKALNPPFCVDQSKKHNPPALLVVAVCQLYGIHLQKSAGGRMATDNNDNSTFQLFKQRGPARTRTGSDRENNALDQKNVREKRKAAGKKRVNVWLDQEAQGIVEQYKAGHGVSQEQALNDLVKLSVGHDVKQRVGAV